MATRETLSHELELALLVPPLTVRLCNAQEFRKLHPENTTGEAREKTREEGDKLDATSSGDAVRVT